MGGDREVGSADECGSIEPQKLNITFGFTEGLWNLFASPVEWFRSKICNDYDIRYKIKSKEFQGLCSCFNNLYLLNYRKGCGAQPPTVPVVSQANPSSAHD